MFTVLNEKMNVSEYLGLLVNNGKLQKQLEENSSNKKTPHQKFKIH